MAQEPGELANQTGKYQNINSLDETCNVDQGVRLPPSPSGGDTLWQWIGPKDLGH